MCVCVRCSVVGISAKDYLIIIRSGTWKHTLLTNIYLYINRRFVHMNVTSRLRCTPGCTFDITIIYVQIIRKETSIKYNIKVCNKENGERK